MILAGNFRKFRWRFMSTCKTRNSTATEVMHYTYLWPVTLHKGYRQGWHVQLCVRGQLKSARSVGRPAMHHNICTWCNVLGHQDRRSEAAGLLAIEIKIKLKKNGSGSGFNNGEAYKHAIKAAYQPWWGIVWAAIARHNCNSTVIGMRK